MPWTEGTIHPRYAETATTIKTYVLGALDSLFRSQYGQAMDEALTPHQRGEMDKVALAATVVAIKGYIPICKDYRRVVEHRSQRAVQRTNRKKTAKPQKTAAK